MEDKELILIENAKEYYVLGLDAFKKQKYNAAIIEKSKSVYV
jgi:hypothetical protein